MRLTLSMKEQSKLLDALQKAPDIITKRLSVTFKNSLESFKDAMEEEAPRSKKPVVTDSRYPIAEPFGLNRDNTRALHKSIEVQQIDLLEGRVFVNKKLAPYGKYVVTGRKGFYVYPKVKQVLRWVNPLTGRFMFGQGHYVKAVSANKFPNRALKNEWPAHKMRMKAALKAGIKEAGL